MKRGEKTKFMMHKEHVDSLLMPVEHDLHFWLEHIVHWHLAALAFALVLTGFYLMYGTGADAASPISDIITQAQNNR